MRTSESVVVPAPASAVFRHIARLEAYHRAALAAHKDHSNVDVSLPEPVLVGVAAGEAESGIGLGGNGDGVRGNGGASLPPRPDER